MLPALLLIPLVAGEVIYRHRGRLALRAQARLALGGGVVLIAGFQAWWVNASEQAGVPKTVRFYAHEVYG